VLLVLAISIGYYSALSFLDVVDRHDRAAGMAVRHLPGAERLRLYPEEKIVTLFRHSPDRARAAAAEWLRRAAPGWVLFFCLYFAVKRLCKKYLHLP